MARACCVCDSKIGSFEKPRQLVEGREDMPLCAECGKRLADARSSNISPENRMALKYHNDALEYYAGKMVENKEMDSAVIEALESFPGLSEYRQNVESERAISAENERRYREERDSVLVTTGFSFEGYRITEYHKVVSADAIIGTGIIAETAAALTDLVGEKSNTLGRKVASAKQSAYSNMLKEAILAGGNAVLGVDYTVYVVGSMLGASASGTSVTIEKL